MLILRIKQAECALADGRLDEAFQLVVADDLRQHRRGQDLSGRLARALVARGREHLAAGRFPQADGDCDKAAQLAGNLPEIAQLRGDCLAAVMAKRHADQRQAQVVAAARQQIQQGQLTLGQQILAKADETANALTLLQDVAARRSVLETIIAKAADALHRDDWEAAVAELAAARPFGSADTRLRELVAQTIALVTGKVSSALSSGRLDLADSLLRRIYPIAEHSVETEQLRRTLEQCRLAWSRIEAGQLHDAEQILRRIATVIPSATWIEPTLKSIEQATDSLEQLRTGPLALLDAAAGFVTRAANIPHARPAPRAGCPPLPPARDALAGRLPNTAPAPAPADPADGLPSRLLIQVDGVGSFYILRGRQVTIGPLSSSHVPDLALLADTATPAISIERSEDDYFLRSQLPVGVNDRLTCGRLLASGDRIALSPRCRLLFTVPSAASSTAALDLNCSKLPRADVRRAILLARELIIGPGGGAHIRCDQMTEPATLFVRDGTIFCQASADLRIDDKPVASTAAIPLDAHIQAGAVSFVITRA